MNQKRERPQGNEGTCIRLEEDFTIRFSPLQPPPLQSLQFKSKRKENDNEQRTKKRSMQRKKQNQEAFIDASLTNQ